MTKELRKLAEAASMHGHHIYTNPRDDVNWQANEAWIDAANPAAILAILDERDQLQAENAGLRSECADLTQRWAEWKDSLDSVMKQRNTLQSNLGDAIQSSAHWQHQFSQVYAIAIQLRGALEHHAEQTRPIQRTTEALVAADDLIHFAAPKALAPLTDERVTKIYNEVCADWVNRYNRPLIFARAIEAAHGIGGTP